MPVVPQEYKDLGVFVRETRKKLDVTQMYIAARVRVSSSYICQIERGTTKANDVLLRKLEGALELRYGTLFMKIGRPPMDLVKTLLEPENPHGDPLSTITPSEKEELIKYLNFLRVQTKLNQFLQQT